MVIVPPGTGALGTLLLLGATAMSAGTAALMVRTSLTQRTSSGLSTGMLLLSSLSYPAWLAYGLGNQNLLQAGCNVVWLAALALWWGYWARDRGEAFAPAAAGVLVWASVLIAATLGGFPYLLLGWAATISGILSSVPQVVSLARAQQVGAGISVPGWTLAATQQALWLGYAYLGGDMPVAVGVSIALALNGAIVVRLAVLRRASHRQAPASTHDRP